MEPRDGLNTDLESFRQQWLSDLRTRKEIEGETREPQNAASSASQPPRRQIREPPAPSIASRPVPHDDDDYVQARAYDETTAPSGHTLTDPEAAAKQELISALDHYEEAMEKEGQGNMGASLQLYRKAYRLDNRVDRRYREKHFPGGVPASTSTTPAASASSATPKSDALLNKPTETLPKSMFELITSFSDLKIEPAPAAVEGTLPPPCPIADLPDELLMHILQDVAISDVGDFVRLSAVCKHLAYLVATEQRIWRRICLGDDVGFGAMHYHWKTAVEWTSLDSEEHDVDGTLVSSRELAERRRGESALVTRSLCPGEYPSWKQMFRERPRIRFNGCYISTVNYVRTGQASTNQATWGGSPIHIVTYYRYLRFHRDGTAISLLTTAEPRDIVHHLTRELLREHHGGAHSYLPSAVMQSALKGRWRLSSSALEHRDSDDNEPEQLQEGDVYIETEGVHPKYMYRMDLTLRSAGKGGTRNNKLAWRGFYSYNKLTDDWGEFGLKNYKPFVFSRVKSYGNGE